MTGAEATDGLANEQDALASAPVSFDPTDRRFRMRRMLIQRLEALKGYEAPTVQEIEEKLWIEGYLAEKTE